MGQLEFVKHPVGILRNVGNYVKQIGVFLTCKKVHAKRTSRESLHNLHATIMQLDEDDLSDKIKSLMNSIDIHQLSRVELQEKLNHATNHATISRRYLAKPFLRPAIELGLVALLSPETPKSKNQKYYLTKDGLRILMQIKNKGIF